MNRKIWPSGLARLLIALLFALAATMTLAPSAWAQEQAPDELFGSGVVTPDP